MNDQTRTDRADLPMVPCLPFDQLERLLDEQLAEADQEALADHVEGCPSCRRRLEDLADARDADRLRPSPGLGPPGPAASFLRRLKERGPRPEPVRHDNDTVANPGGGSSQRAGRDGPSATVAPTVAGDFRDADAGPDPTGTVSAWPMRSALRTGRRLGADGHPRL